MSGHTIIDGVPYINDKPATWDEKAPLLDCFSQWRCPECRANLDAETLICLNACHLSESARKRLQEGYVEAARRIRERESK